MLDPQNNSHQAEALLIEHASLAMPNQFGSFGVARNPTGIRERCREFARCIVVLHVPPKVIKDTNEVAIQISGHKLAQLPRFVLGLGNDLCMRGLPLCEEFIYCSLALEIEPEKNRTKVSVGLSKRPIGDKQSAIPP